jgi:hypothetical protein
LPISPVHVDSATSGDVIALSSGRTQLFRFNSTLQQAGTETLPLWADDGYGRTASATKAFLDSTGAKRIAVVSDTATPRRYGLVTFP